MLCFVFSALVVLLDQFFKRWISLTVVLNEDIELIPGVLGLTHVRNTGAAFSVLDDQRWLLVGISFVACVLLVFILLRYNEGFWGTLGLSALLGGAAGNLFDRLFHGEVVDMFKPLFIDFAIFNIADIFITLGGITFCVFFLVSSIRGPRRRELADGAGESYDGEEDREPGGEEDVRIYDRAADTRAVTSRRRAARQAAAQAEEYGGPQQEEYYNDEAPDRDYTVPGEYNESGEYIVPGEQNGSGAGYQEDQYAYPEQYEQYDYGQTPGSYDAEQTAEQGVEAWSAPPGGESTGGESTALDMLSALESELSEEDLLGVYDVDEILKEYGFEDEKKD